MADLHVTTAGTSGPQLLLVHGSFSWGEDAWAAQRELAERFRLAVLDRRGFGESAAAARVDFEVDAGDIAAVAERLGGTHLVGHSYGGVACLVAAERRPAAVRSLTVIEPPAFGLAPDAPAVRRLVEGLRAHFRDRQQLDPEEFQRAFLASWGLDPAPPRRLTARAEAAFRASMTERPPWEARPDLAAIAAAGIPALVVRGAWDAVPARARELAGAAFAAVCDTIEAALGAERAVFPGAAHRPQALGAPFNERLATFVSAVEARRR